MRGSRRRGTHRDGFVLVSVLAVTSLLALIVGGAALASRGSIETAHLGDEALALSALAASGIELAGHQLFVLRVDPRTLDGQVVRLDTGTVTLRVRPEAGRVDLNGADPVLLAAAARAAGLAAPDPDLFASQVEGLRAGEGGVVAPFRSIGDLLGVAGIGPAELARLAPFLTIANPAGKLDPLYADGRLLAAVPGVRDDVAALVAQAASLEGLDRVFALRFALRGLERHFVLGESLRAFSVQALARRAGSNATRTVDAVLIAPVLADRPFQITQWVER